jgi:hypothetical protein
MSGGVIGYFRGPGVFRVYKEVSEWNLNGYWVEQITGYCDEKDWFRI